MKRFPPARAEHYGKAPEITNLDGEREPVDLLSKAVMWLVILFLTLCFLRGLVLTVWDFVDWLRGMR